MCKKKKCKKKELIKFGISVNILKMCHLDNKAPSLIYMLRPSAGKRPVEVNWGKLGNSASKS